MCRGFRCCSLGCILSINRFWHDHGQLEPMGRTGFREKMKLQKEKCYPLLVLPRILMNPYNTPFLHRPLEHLHQAAGDAMDEALELLEGEHASVKSQRGSQTGGCKDRTLSESEGDCKQLKFTMDLLDSYSDVSQMLEVAMDILEDSLGADVEEPIDDIEEYLEHVITSSEDRTRAWVLAHC